jgi:hypothetical protein
MYSMTTKNVLFLFANDYHKYAEFYADFKPGEKKLSSHETDQKSVLDRITFYTYLPVNHYNLF